MLKIKNLSRTLLALAFLSALFQLPVHADTPGECNELVTRILESSSSEKPKLTIRENSLFAKNELLAKQMQDLSAQDLDFPGFYKKFQEINQRAPTLRDALEMIYLDRQTLLNSYQEVIDLYEQTPDPIVQAFTREMKAAKDQLDKFKDIDLVNEDLAKAYDDGKVSFSSLDVDIKLQNENPDLFEEEYYRYLKDRSNIGAFHGAYGELMTYGSLDQNVLHRSLTFQASENVPTDSFQAQVIERVAQLREQLEQMTEQEIRDFIKPHEEGLFRHAKEYLDEVEGPYNHTDVVDRMINFIKSKEIDLVSQNSGEKIVWTEVKSYSKKISESDLEGHSKKKSILDQLAEHKSLRDVLGFEDEIDLRFVTPMSELTPEAQRLIEQAGFSVISAY